MNIAFVGKGGSGKSTVSLLFIKHLSEMGERVLAIDADINMHLADLLSIQRDDARALSYGINPLAIREYLIGRNRRITCPKSFIKTTPPGEGSNFISLKEDNPIVRRYATQFSGTNFFMHVGTYQEDEIGTSCYHSNLSIFENVVSHTVTRDHEWLVADMVAGTDAFAGPLYFLFDILFLVVEPTPEALSVYEQFKKLAEKGGTWDRVLVIGNKVQDDDDLRYIQERVRSKLCAVIPSIPAIKKARQNNSTLHPTELGLQNTLLDISTLLCDKGSDPDATLHLLHALHRKHAQEDYIIARHGNLTEQIDPLFSFKHNVS